MISRGDRDLGVHDRQLLDALDKGSYIGVPVIFDGRTWGKLEAFANVGAVPFTRRHVPFLEAIAGQVGAAIGRAELFSRVNALAYARPAHRARQPARARRAPGGRGRPRRPARDRVLRPRRAQADQRHARPRRRATPRSAAPPTRSPPPRTAHAGASVYRVGGDEFCVVLEGGDAEAAARLAAAAGTALGAATAPLSLSCGAAALRPGDRPADLFRAADAAQYAAKRGGRGRVVVAGTADAAGCRRRPDRRARRDRTSAETRRARRAPAGRDRRRARAPSAPSGSARALERRRPDAYACRAWTSQALARAVPRARTDRLPQQRHRRPVARRRGRRRARRRSARRSATAASPRTSSARFALQDRLRAAYAARRARRPVDEIAAHDVRRPTGSAA